MQCRWTLHARLRYDGDMRLRWVAVVIAIGLGVDLLSFIGWSDSALLVPFTVAVLTAVAIGTFLDIRIGVTAVLLELLWGGHGYLLRIPWGGVDISLRMGVFFVVLAATVWHLRVPGARRAVYDAAQTHPARWPALAFFVSLVVGLIGGLVRHPFDRVFFDANAFGFLLLTPAFSLAIQRRTSVENHSLIRTNRRMVIGSEIVRGDRDATGPPIIRDSLFIILAGAFYLIARTYFLLFAFTHDLGGTWVPLYQWVRDTRLGEVTVFPGAFPRVFMPSMVLLFPAIAIAMTRIRVWSRIREYAYGTTRMKQQTFSHSAECENVESGALRTIGRSPTLSLGVFGGGVAILLVSLSRSYWVGLATLIGFKVFMTIRTRCVSSDLSQFRAKLRKAFRGAFVLIGSTIIAVAIAVAIVNLPYRKPLTTAGIGSTFLARLSADAAVSNRWQQIEPLRNAIAQHPIFGNGFGAAVTYETKDPRTLAAFPDGRYTTTAFEWGYLDDLLERGTVGFLAEIWLIGALIWYGFRNGGYAAAVAAGLAAVAVVHATSPYLNHPLGIGLLMLAAASMARPIMVHSSQEAR